MNTYVKLSAVKEFLLESIEGYSWFMLDATINKPQKSQEWFEGASKTWNLITDKGNMTVSQGQMSQMLVAAFDGQISEPVGKTFTVKTNGKEGKDRRYFINLKKTEAKEEQVDVSNIPF